MSAAAPEVASAPAQDATKTETEPGFKVFAGNLAYATTDAGLKAFFAPVADDILSAQVIQRGTRSAGYGFVTLSTTTAVEKAVAELNGKELDARAILVEAAKPAADKEKEREEKRAQHKISARSGRRGNKAPTGEVTEAEANGEASPVDGEAADAKKKRTKKTRKPKKKTDGEAGAATTTEGADIPAEADAEAVSGEKKAAKKPRAPRKARAPGTQPVGEPSKSVVFVANLAFNVDDEALGNLFKEAAINVVSARVVRRRFGQPRRSKGYGFVDVGDEENQRKALEHFNGKEVSGREIAVKIAVSAQHEDEDGDEAPAALTEKALAEKNVVDAAAADAVVVAH